LINEIRFSHEVGFRFSIKNKLNFTELQLYSNIFIHFKPLF